MKNLSKIILILCLLFVVFSIALVAILLLTKEEETPEAPVEVSSGPVSIPKEILDNKFGFLSGHPGAEELVADVGGRWARPHVGPFLWDSMQESSAAEIDFEQTDAIVKSSQENRVAILATLWPFAEWDQENHPDFNSCEVNPNDTFLAVNFKKDDKGEGPIEKDKPEELLDDLNKPGKELDFDEPDPSYLPLHRCNPTDWGSYTSWVKSVVERYDGDGQDDMPGLKFPIKYWEVMNEPDLAMPEPEIEDEQEQESLNFFAEENGPDAYAELLIKTNLAIKSTDSDALVLIAGAAGGNDRFLGFYSEVFDDPETHTAFDIGNVHCISNDEYQNFNVAPYQELLAEFGLDKPIWVTEAESIISSDEDINATQTFESTKNAIALGAEKIFYTRFTFYSDPFGDKFMPDEQETIEPTLDGGEPEEVFQTIINYSKYSSPT